MDNNEPDDNEGEEFFRLPDSVASLDELPEDVRHLYDPDTGPDGGFIIADDARELRDESDAQLAKMREEHAAKLAKMEAELEYARSGAFHAKERAETTRLRVDSALTAALTAAGVKPGLQRAAKLLIHGEYSFETELSEFGDQTVFARTGLGLYSTPDVVAAFLDSPDGEGFRPANRMRSAGGTFSAMLGAIGKKK